MSSSTDTPGGRLIPSFTTTPTSTTNTSPSLALQTSLLPHRNSFSATTRLPSKRSVLRRSRPSPVLALTTSVASSSPSSTTPPHPKPKKSTLARRHGQTTTRSSKMSTFPSSHTLTSAKTPRASILTAWSAPSSLPPKAASSSCTPVLTTRLVSTLLKISGNKSLLS